MLCYVQEVDAAVSVLGEMDAWIICPFFLEGGRHTIDDIHYVTDSDRFDFSFLLNDNNDWFNFKSRTLTPVHGLCPNRLVPAGETEFARDAAFGYKSSNLREVLCLNYPM